jgi:hypothetical protein
MIEKSSLTEHPYKILSVQRAEPPADAEGSNWHGYVITQGTNVIHGCRQGNLETVTGVVENIVAQLNERRLGKRGRVHLVMTPKKKPQA